MTSNEIPPKKLKAFEQRANRPSNRLRQPNPPSISPEINVVIENIQSVEIQEPNSPSQQSSNTADDESAKTSTTLAPATETPTIEQPGSSLNIPKRHVNISMDARRGAMRREQMKKRQLRFDYLEKCNNNKK